MIEINNVTKRFHTLVALDNLSLKIQKGEVIGVLGPNGAGKTTLFKLIVGFLQPDQGFLRPITADWPVIGYKPERLLFPNHMRVWDYLAMSAQLSNIPQKDVKQTVGRSLESVNLAGAAGKKIKDCSKGMRQRLGLAQAMIGNPALLLLDEPSNGLDPEGQDEICHQIKTLHASGMTIVLASHQLHEVTQVCTYLIILNRGTIHYENRMVDALAERPHITITVTSDTTPLKRLFKGMHKDIELMGNKIILNYEAMVLRRQVLSLLISAGYDILTIDQSRVSLAEIYAEAVR